jgi:aryl-alcohol dehydrogenase-like predicted oxidoreductase
MTQRPEPYAHLRSDDVYDGIERLERHAAEHGTSPAALAIAWLLADPRLAAVVVGPRRPAHLEPALAALQIADLDRDLVGGLVGSENF